MLVLGIVTVAAILVVAAVFIFSREDDPRPDCEHFHLDGSDEWH